jgi:transposase-like protein
VNSPPVSSLDEVGFQEYEVQMAVIRSIALIQYIYVKVQGQWHYLYRAVDKTCQTIDFLLTEERNEQAAKRWLTKAIHRHGVPATTTLDGSEANAAAIRSYNQEHGTAILIRQVKYLNNIVEQAG